VILKRIGEWNVRVARLGGGRLKLHLAFNTAGIRKAPRGFSFLLVHKIKTPLWDLGATCINCNRRRNADNIRTYRVSTSGQTTDNQAEADLRWQRLRLLTSLYCQEDGVSGSINFTNRPAFKDSMRKLEWRRATNLSSL
jgi:hypothetical protein